MKLIITQVGTLAQVTVQVQGIAPLPKATPATLGAVRPGSGLSIDGDGVMSVAVPAASALTSGIVRVGTGLAVDGNGLLSVARRPTGPLIACGQMPLPEAHFDDTTSNSLNARQVCRAPATAGLTDIIVALPGFGLANPEADFPATYTATAAIEYPAGVFTPLYAAGARSLFVSPGRVLKAFDPAPIYIPPGAPFWIKLFVTWPVGHFWLTIERGAFETGAWTARGTGLADHTLDATPQVSNSGFGFSAVVYATPSTPISGLGVIGDSISAGVGQAVEPLSGSVFAEMAMGNQIPVINLARGSDSLALYLQRYEGRRLVLRDAITHLLMAHCRNDLAEAPATMQSNFQAVVAPFLAQGIPTWAVTALPTTTSTDGWVSAAGQTPASTEGNRQTFNAWLRANWQAMGLSGLFDWAHVIDPTDSGKWGFDAGSTGRSAAGFATVAGGALTAVAPATYNGFSNSYGQSFTPGQVPCTVYPSPDDTGAGAVVTGTAGGDGTIRTYTIANPGGGYTRPPLIAPNGAWTNEGTHPCHRGTIEIIHQTGLRPGLFVS